jgi:hypothetical protein
MMRMMWMAGCRMTGAALGVVVLFVFASASADLAAGTKVVFLKENEVVSVNADGSEQRTLTHDGVPKERPVWSPDGAKIAYLTALSAEDAFRPPKVLALINVITADGRPVKSIPVLAAMPDGTPILGMRSVEDSGWFSDSAVFVSGSENPHYAEYRIFDVASAKPVKVYAGYGFATCASQGEVAYVADPDEANPEKLDVQVNGRNLIQVPADRDPRYFSWSSDCDRLAYLEGGDAASLVVLRKNVVEARVTVGAGFDGTLIVPTGTGFLLKEAGRTEYYDVTRKALLADPHDSKAMPATDLPETADDLVRRLGGTSGNQWSAREK